MFNGLGPIPDRTGLICASPSRLKLLRECPELYKYRYVDGNKDETDSQELGTLVHMRTFEREKFDAKYAQLPEKTESNSLGLESLKDLCEKYGLKKSGTKAELVKRIRENNDLEPQFEELLEVLREGGRETLPPALMDKVIKISDKITSHPSLIKLLNGAQKEARAHYTDDKSGVVVEFQTDAYNVLGGIGIVLDLKVTKDWEPKFFERSNFKEARHMLAACYLKGMTKATGQLFNRFVHIAVEPKAPFRVRIYDMDEAALDAGETELDVWLADYKKRVTLGDYSPRNGEDKIITTTLTSWDWNNIPEIPYE